MSADPGPGSEGRETDRPGAHDPDTAPPQSAGQVAAVAFAALLYFPIKNLLDSHPSGLRLGLVLTGAAGFVVVYLWRLVFTPTAARPTRATLLSVAVAALLAGALVVGDSAPRWAPLFIFLSAVIGVRAALPWSAFGVAGCTVLAAAVLAPVAPIGNTLAIAVQTLAIGAFTVGMSRLRATITELQDAREQLAQLAVTEERLRFARDLHDLLGHSLSVIALKADLARQLLPDHVERAGHEVADIDSVARHALAEVRDAVSGYRQPTIAEAVATGRLALDAAGIDTTCDIAQVALPPALDAVLAWTLREGITNVIRHSRARHCRLRVTAGLVEATAEVTDDGVGGPSDPEVTDDGVGGPSDADAPVATDAPPGSRPGSAAGLPGWAGNGLRGLAERVGALHGRLEVAARPEGGFRIKASIPTAASRGPAR